MTQNEREQQLVEQFRTLWPVDHEIPLGILVVVRWAAEQLAKLQIHEFLQTRATEESFLLQRAREYGRMKLLGFYVENGMRIRCANRADEEDMIKMFRERLLFEAEGLIRTDSMAGDLP